jgi:DNA-binding NarL/FixJ family response regulator
MSLMSQPERDTNSRSSNDVRLGARSSTPTSKAVRLEHDFAGVTVVVGQLDPLLSGGLQGVLAAAQDLRVMARDLRGPALERFVQCHTPNVVIVDDTAEHTLITRLAERHPAVAVLVIGATEPPLYRSALRAIGAICIARSTTPDRLLAVLHDAAFSPSSVVLRDHGLDTERGASLADRLNLLTTREAEVLEFLVHGATDRDIAEALVLARSTVKTHTAQIRRKLRVKDRRELIRIDGSSIRAHPYG